MDSITNEISTLLNIVNKLKIKEIKLKNGPEKITEIVKKEEMLKDYEKNRKNNCKKLEEIYQNINNTLLDLKKSEFYLQSKKIIGDNKA